MSNTYGFLHGKTGKNTLKPNPDNNKNKYSQKTNWRIKMKTSITFLLLLVLSVVGNAQKLDGNWKGKMTTPNGDMELLFTFKVDAAVLTGSIKSEMGTMPIANGKVNGNNFSFDINVNDQVMSNTGVLDGNVVKLTAPMMEKPLELTRVEEKSNVEGKSKIEGKWIGKATSEQGEFELTFTFKVDGEKLTGKNSSSMGEMDLTNGKVNGNDFSFDIDMQGMKLTHKCKYLENDTIELKVNVMEQDMVMKLTRAAQ
jgi:hypothetical protein